MDDKHKFYRDFLMFSQEDTGSDSAQQPSGYLRIEVREDKGKISVMTQHLKEDPDNINYKAYILKCGEREVIPVLLGRIRFQKGRGELQMEFNPDDVASTGIPIGEFNTAVVLAEYRGSENAGIICPLASYKEKKIAWRDKLKEFLYPVKTGEDVTEVTGHGGNVENEDGETYGNEDGRAGENESNIAGGNKDEHEKMHYNTCLNCPAQKTEEGINRNDSCSVDLDRLRENLDKYFETYNPFGNRRGNYSWWKVSSPVYLNNILYQHNIKTPLLFNPAAMMAHFKYRHLIIGIYSDKVRRKEYIVCGVPGVYCIDDKPFGDMCRWVQLEGYRPRYGAFGYWVAYVDPKTGRLLRVN